MNRIPFGMLFIFSFLQASIPNDPFLEYQKYLSRMGACSEIPNLPLLLKITRQQVQGISEEDYEFLKGTSGFVAPGAQWAHHAGVLGQCSKVLLLEDSGINHADMQRIVEKNSLKTPISNHAESSDHGSAMVSLIHAIAPQAKIYVVPTNEVGTSFIASCIINASFGSSQSEGFINHFNDITASAGVLIVKSAGNHQQDLSTHPYTKNCDRLLPFTIFAGNLGQDYKARISSGFPGKNPKIQKSFLWTVGEDILGATGPDGSTQYAPISGTSCSAAIISGAASLFPSLTAAEKREVLLESADRDIFQEFGSGYEVIHIPDPILTYYRQQSQIERGVDSLDALSIEHVPSITYDKKLWGMGILNIRNALLYQGLKIAFPEMKPAALRNCMLKLINRKEQVKATIIQNAFRKHQHFNKQQADGFEKIYVHKGIMINTSLKRRTFDEVPPIRPFGIPPSVRELTNDERLERLSIILPEPPTRINKVKTAFPFQITDHQWKACKAPRCSSEKLKAFIEARSYDVEKTFNAFFWDELLVIIRSDPAWAADMIFQNYHELLRSFSANKVITIGRNWVDELGPHYISKIFHSSTTIIGLIHDGIRNKDLVEKSRLFAFSMHLYEKILNEGLMTDKIKSAILALLKDTKEEIDQRFFSFMKKHHLLLHWFNAFIVEENVETDMLEVHARQFRGIDLFSDAERKMFRISIVGEQ
ncbi:MAG: S8/S53 family peptidase [Pseudomonadota bacterium]|jgi:hypothetical protein|nr:S8/S53 family peptidase [Alphaproteobacteria bacterium]